MEIDQSQEYLMLTGKDIFLAFLVFLFLAFYDNCDNNFKENLRENDRN